jgi:hypothetical protein
VIVIGASVLKGEQMVKQDGVRSLVNTQDGRGAVLGAVGGSLMLMPFPPAQLGAAVVMAGAAANGLGAFKHFDRPDVSPSGGPSGASAGAAAVSTGASASASGGASSGSGGGTAPTGST